jgi:hypothetical protein
MRGFILYFVKYFVLIYFEFNIFSKQHLYR